MTITEYFAAVSRWLAVFWVGCMMLACGGGADKDKEARKPSFTDIVGIDFYEVRRAFDNGLAYDSIGFVQVPEWHLKFIDEDSIQVYSISQDSMFTYTVYHDHDSFFHFARESWKVVDLHPDSLMLQRLSLKGLKVDRIRSNVYMRFYSKEYIQNKLHTTVEELRKPRRQDTLFVQAMAARANQNPSNPDSAFASVNMAGLEPNHPMINVKRRRTDSLKLMEQSAAYAYLYPEYDITINGAYRDFYYTFSALVDERGTMRLGKVNVMPEFEEDRKRVITGIIEVYLQNLLDITPASTLGIPHTSVIYLRVRGRKE